MKANAAVLWAKGDPLEVTEIDVADPKQGEVTVEISAAGICHSDLSMVAGKIGQPLPAVPGHEATGIIRAVGPGVTSVEEGDHVVLVYRPYCGQCFQCVRGRPTLCPAASQMRVTGFLGDGTSRFSHKGTELFHFSAVSAFSELTVVPENGVVAIDRELPLDVLSVVGCAVLTGYGAVVNAADLRPGEAAAVLGCGGVGLNAVQACRISGANPIIAIDHSDSALALAREFGATETVNPTEVDAVEAVRDLSGGGVDFVFEAVGGEGLIEMSLELLRPGGSVIVIGVPSADLTASFSPGRLLGEEKSIVGSLSGSAKPRFDIPRVLDLWQAGALQIDQLVTHRYPLAEINDGFAALANGLEGRAILELATG